MGGSLGQDEPSSIAAPLVAIKDPGQHWCGAAWSRLPLLAAERGHATAARRARPLLGPWVKKEEMGPHLPPNEAGGQRKEPAENRRRRKDPQSPYKATGKWKQVVSHEG